MKQIILFGFMLLAINSYSQTKNGYYVTNNNDTIKCEFMTSSMLFSDDIDISVFHGPITVIENGVKKKFKPHEIKSFTVFENENKKHKFGSFSEEKKYFVNILVDGCLTLGNLYSFHPYDHSYYPLSAFIKDGIIYRINLLNSKKIIEKLISDSPKIHTKWMNKEYKKSGIEQLAKDYNEDMCKR